MLSAMSSVFGKKPALDVGDVTKSASAKASKKKDMAVDAETAFSEALNEKSGAKAVAALQSAQPEELKHIASDKALMKEMNTSLDSSSLQQCHSILCAQSEKASDKSSGGKKKSWWSSALDTGKGWLDSGKAFVSNAIETGTEFVSNAIETGTEFVSNVIDSGKEIVSNVTDYIQNFDPQKEGSKIYQSTVGKLPDNARRLLVSNAYSMGGLISPKLMGADLEENHKKNAEFLAGPNSPLNNAAKNGGYIEDQNASSSNFWSQIAYGSSNMENSGCGVIATYNALNALGEIGENPSPEILMEIISEYENGGAVIGGLAGSTPKAILKYFQKTGHDARMTSNFSVENLNNMEQNYDTYVLVGLAFSEDGTIQYGHYISITRNQQSTVNGYNYTVHNNQWGVSYGTKTLRGAIDSLAKNSDPFSLIGIKGKLAGVSTEEATTGAAGGATKSGGSASGVATTEPGIMEKVNTYKTNLVNFGSDALAAVTEWGKGLIPQHVPNDVIVGAYKLMGSMDASSFASMLGGNKVEDFIRDTILQNATNTMTASEIQDHKTENTKRLAASDSPLGKSYIENQADWKNILFGKGLSNMSYSGCEIIATYNALYAMGESPSMPELIANYESGGMALNGQFGTSPEAIYNYFVNEGFDASMITDFSSEDKINELADKYDTFITTVYNNSSDITDMIHTVSITKTGSGSNARFSSHNTYTVSNNKYVSQDGFATLSDAIASVHSEVVKEDRDGNKTKISTVKPISLISINGKSAK